MRRTELFADAKTCLGALEYLADRHAALDKQFPAYFSTQAAELLQKLSVLLVDISALFPSAEERQIGASDGQS